MTVNLILLITKEHLGGFSGINKNNFSDFV